MKPPTGSSTETKWSFPQKLLFRFSFIFFGLYIIPFPVNYLPIVSAYMDWTYDAWSWLVIRTGKYILHLPYEITVMPNGSGDTTWNWVHIFLILSSALLGMVIWSFLDRKRSNYQQLLYWFTAAIRYYLSFTLIAYGSFKIFKSQFPAPGLYRLTESYGESSPMGLAWTFLGYSEGYNFFMGWAEALGGLLLLLKKTKTIGALICMTVTANIMAINYCFDVPVKIFSTMLFLMAVFIAAPDIYRLFQFFILNRDAKLKSNGSSIKSQRGKIVLLVFKLIFISYFLYKETTMAISGQAQYGDKAPKSNLYGNYQVETYIKNKDSIPPSLTDQKRWKRIILAEYNGGSVQMTNDSLTAYTYHEDSNQHILMFYDRWDSKLLYTFSYLHIDKNHLELRGKDSADGIYMKLLRRDPKDFLLIKRGFHWINEYPFNR